MKKFLTILGAIFLVLIVLGLVLFGYAAFRGSRLDASSKAYVDTSIPAIVSNWSEDELQKRASSELVQAATPEKMEHLFEKLKELGTLQKYEGSKGDSHISLTTQYGKVITADYTASTIFQNGTAKIKIRLIQKNGEWQILDFYVDSPMFSK